MPFPSVTAAPHASLVLIEWVIVQFRCFNYFISYNYGRCYSGGKYRRS